MMNSSIQIARNLREVYFGENWTSVNFKDTLSVVDWQRATTKIKSFNTIATLVYHTNYYIDAITQVLKGHPLDAHDKYSFEHAPVLSSLDWENMLNKTWTNVEMLAGLIEKLPDHKLWDIFSEEKYGTYYRNLLGLIEHAHYHLGQIVILNKFITDTED